MSAISLNSPGVDPGAQNKLVTFVIVIVGYFLLRSEWRKFQQDRTYASVGSDPNAQFAVRLHQAFEPLGFDWLGGLDGTNLEEVMNIASQMKDFNAVATAYQNLYTENLTERLRKELKPDELQRFWGVLGASTGTANPNTNPRPVPGTAKVYALVSGPLRDADKPNETVKTVSPGEEIGTFAGSVFLKFTNTGTVEAVLVKYKNWLFFEKTGVIEARLVSVR